MGEARIDHNAPQASRVPNGHGTPVVETDDAPVPRRVVPPGDRNELTDARCAVDGQQAGHAEPDADDRAAVGVEQEQLSPASSRGEPVADQEAT